MIDGNISMEEDTELRDLVVQTLENNGVLAKVRAELRASVFLALEEQESVVNPEPLLNKTVKQYLANSEGKLLFSLVREFLEYFGLDYTISVYDPETYIGKEYNYMGRNKLCEKLGINSTEPLLGELLKNSINGTFNNSKNESINDSNLKSCETSNINNETFDVSIPQVVHKESTSLSNDNDSSEKAESISDFSQEIPINVTITDKKTSGKILTNALIDTSSCEVHNKSLRENTSSENDCETDKNKLDDNETGNNNLSTSSHNNSSPTQNNQNSPTTNCPSYGKKNDNESKKLLNKSEHLIKFDESNVVESELDSNEESKSKITAAVTTTAVSSVELQNTNNAQNLRKVDVDNNSFSKTVYFEEIIVDGKLEKVGATKKNESLLGDLPPLVPKTNSIFSDLPPLNGKKTNINDLKELMDIGLTGDPDNYEEDFVSSASGSTNEQSPAKNPDKNIESPVKQLPQTVIDDKSQSARSEEISEDIDEIEEVLSTNISCLDDTSGDNKSIANFAMGNALDCTEKA
ncbi:probable serine/threonine-protein kinase DDB_G0276461 isoform X1 [Cotesia glomerata]|uniref:probable serine/threonine-protein kinase DDB_G0276461 isoform X1 n=1 Tax=Cotesia glomerata TaxID=32391 RepID=UPI001D01F72B|nr:probable serine/threonine-protein kinase DDB_G0276461 isoform X1 [Cotesia glomerata]